MWSGPSWEGHCNPRLCSLGPALCDAPSPVMKTAARTRAEGERRVAADGRSARAPHAQRPGTQRRQLQGAGWGRGLRGRMSCFLPGSYPGIFQVCLKHSSPSKSQVPESQGPKECQSIRSCLSPGPAAPTRLQGHLWTGGSAFPPPADLKPQEASRPGGQGAQPAPVPTAVG